MGIILSIDINIQIRRMQPEAESILASFATDTEDNGSQDNLSELTIHSRNTSDDEDIQRIIFDNTSNHSRRVYMTRGQPLTQTWPAENQTEPTQNQTQPAQNEPELVENLTQPVAVVNPFTHNSFRRSPFESQRSLVRRNSWTIANISHQQDVVANSISLLGNALVKYFRRSLVVATFVLRKQW